MKADVAAMMENWERHNLTMEWATVGYSLNNGNLCQWATGGGGGPTPQPLPTEMYNCFEAIFLAAVHAMQANRASLNAIYMDGFPNFQSGSLVHGGLRTFRRSSGWFPRLPERGDLVIFGDNCEHVTLATGHTVPGLIHDTETEVLSFWADHTGHGSVPAKVSLTTVESLSTLLNGLGIAHTVYFGAPRW